MVVHVRFGFTVHTQTGGWCVYHHSGQQTVQTDTRYGDNTQDNTLTPASPLSVPNPASSSLVIPDRVVIAPLSVMDSDTADSDTAVVSCPQMVMHGCVYITGSLKYVLGE